MTGVFWFLIEILSSLLVSACLLRALAFHVRLSSLNQVQRFLSAATDWLIRPLGKLIPRRRSVDLPSISAAVLICVLTAALSTVLFAGLERLAGAGMWALAFYWLCKWALYLLIGMLILQAVLSWVNPSAPIAPVLDLLTAPFLRPVRRFLPLLGGVDLSPLVLIIVAQLLLALIENLLLSAGGLR
jgi:YggT family protein